MISTPFTIARQVARGWWFRLFGLDDGSPHPALFGGSQVASKAAVDCWDYLVILRSGIKFRCNYVTRRGLDTGDYSERSLLQYLRIERKGDDLPACCGVERTRFMDQMWRLKSYPVKALVLEYGWPEIEMGNWNSKIAPQAVISTLLGIIEMGIPVIAAGNRARAGKYIAKLIFLSANRRYRELRGMLAHVTGEEAELQEAQA